jgi:hypothetical protein
MVETTKIDLGDSQDISTTKKYIGNYTYNINYKSRSNKNIYLGLLNKTKCKFWILKYTYKNTYKNRSTNE